MLGEQDILILKLALERGLLAGDRLPQALEEYPKTHSAARCLRALGVDGKAVGLLVDQITPTGTNERGALLARCDVENLLMGRALTHAQLVSTEDLAAAEQVVQEQAARGVFHGVSEILVEQGKLDVLRAAELGLRAKALVATCPTCFQHHLLRARKAGRCTGCGGPITAGEGASATDAWRPTEPQGSDRVDAITEAWDGADPTITAQPGQLQRYQPPSPPQLPTLQPGLPGSPGSDRFLRAEQSTIAGREQSIVVGDEEDSLNVSEAVAQFGAYEILEEVARGASGVVYKARRKGWSRPVALKVLVAGAKASPREVARFEREANVGRTVRHPGLVKVFDSGVHGGYRFLTMEFIEGPTLEEVCVTPLPLERAVEVMAAVCDAVEALHQQGVIHRDLKPSNVILRTQDGRPKLIDLGLVKVQDDLMLTQSSSSLGTPAYMSPEQVRGDLDLVGPATDVYALGAILFFLLTADVPVLAENYMDLFRQIVEEEQTRPSRVNGLLPASVDALVLKAMSKQPHDRYPDPAALRAALLALDLAEAPAALSDAEASAAASEPEESVGKQLLVVLGLLLGAAAILAVGYLLLQR